MDDTPSQPNRRKLTLGDFTTIIMTQIKTPEQPIRLSKSNQVKRSAGE